MFSYEQYKDMAVCQNSLTKSTDSPAGEWNKLQNVVVACKKVKLLDGYNSILKIFL